MTQNINVFTEKLHVKWRKFEALDNTYVQKHMVLSLLQNTSQIIPYILSKKI